MSDKPKPYDEWFASDYLDGLLNGTITGRDNAECLYDDYLMQFAPEKKPADRRYVVRRLTPLECCRLQGFPDDWCEGVPGSDSAQYKMWGNGMALPNMHHVMRGIMNLHQDELLEDV